MKTKTFIFILALVLLFLLTNLAWGLKEPWNKKKKLLEEREHPWGECQSVLPDSGSSMYHTGELKKAETISIVIPLPVMLPGDLQLLIISFKDGRNSLEGRRANHSDNWAEKWMSKSKKRIKF